MRRLLLYIVYILLTPGLIPAQQAPTLWHDQQRSIRYKPDGNDFVIAGGGRRFNRALYGTHTAFRVEAGDLPEFALYMPGMGGNWRFELLQGNHHQWLTKSKVIRAAYRPGSMLYEIRDPLLGKGVLYLTVLALADGEGMIIKVATVGVDPHTRLRGVFGGASGKKFSRDGDIGADPESSFDCKPEYCRGNRYSIDKNAFHLAYAESGQLEGVFPPGSQLSVVDSMLTGMLPLAADSTLYFLVRKPLPGFAGPASFLPSPAYSALPALFDQAEVVRQLWH